MKNKILPVREKIAGLLVIFIYLSSGTMAQQLPLSRYGLPYVNSISLYKKTIIDLPEKEMISLTAIAGIFLDLRYATENNFYAEKNVSGKYTKSISEKGCV